MTNDKAPTVYNIPPTISFTDILAKSLIEEVDGAPEKLSQYLILLPTRRGCRNVQEAFLRQSDGKPIMLPRLHPIGDVDGEELAIGGHGHVIDNILPAMPSMKRQILLARLIGNMPKFSKGTQSDMRLAAALGQLMDQTYTEDLNLVDLPSIVDKEAFADHWQVTVSFLEILSQHWPKILEQYGMIDSADRRNRLINALQQFWEITQPDYPILAAGSTGSIPATSKLLKTISSLPQGAVILPGLDQNMSENAWDLVEEGHPQYTLKDLLDNMGCTRQDVKTWPNIGNISEQQHAREKFISYAMAPPEYTHEWQKVTLNETQKTDLESSLKNVTRLDCETIQDEALHIAILIRETLETPEKTAALITPNRFLAHRVATICQRWGIDVDDSGGIPLNETPISLYLKSIVQCAVTNFAPVPLLSTLKHNLSNGAGFENYRKSVRQLDKTLLRGLKPAGGLAGLKKQYEIKLNDTRNRHKPTNLVIDLINHLENVFEPLDALSNNKAHPFSDILKAHLSVAEKLSGYETSQGSDILWRGEAGETMANFLSELNGYANDMPPCTLNDYLNILDHFMQSMSVRPQYGTHPRLMILGQLEARLIQTSRIILSGLNEGMWPPDPGHDPWMSRPMRVNFGLPKPERAITLAAHDFSQAFCGREVFLTRSERDDGAPTVPARWLQRMDTFMKAIDLNADTMRQSNYTQYAQMLDRVETVTPVERPTPTPSADARPDYLSVTKIETWMKDPYGIYAGQILKLGALDQIEKEIGAAERGNILHDVLEKFNETYPKNIPDTARANFIQIARDVLNDNDMDEAEWNFWLPRMSRLSDWLIPHEQEWRENATFGKAEAKGTIQITQNLQKPFTLSGRADRIDYLNDGNIAIIDYKSGGAYTAKGMLNGDLPQLPLEAYILNEGGFKEAGIHQNATGYIGYWKLTGGTKAGDITAIDDKSKLGDAIKTTKNGLQTLIKTYEDEAVPYLAIPNLDNAPRFNDFEHLERVKEWAALDENNEEAA